MTNFSAEGAMDHLAIHAHGPESPQVIPAQASAAIIQSMLTKGRFMPHVPPDGIGPDVLPKRPPRITQAPEGEQ
jgi:hypothetical protein